MLSKTLFLALVIFVNKPSHDLQMTLFTFEKNEASIVLSVTFDKDHLLKHIANSTELILENAALYLNKNISTQINKKWVEWNFCTYTENKKTITLESNPILFADEVKSVKIKNTTLITEVEKQINMIHLLINQQKRSFRMDRNRQFIEAKY